MANTDEMIKKYCKRYKKDYLIINNDMDMNSNKIVKEKRNQYRMNL